MSLPSVTPAQYRALEAVEKGLVSLNADGTTTVWKPAGVSQPSLAIVIREALVRASSKPGPWRGLVRAELTDLGQQVLDAKRGEGDRG